MKILNLMNKKKLTAQGSITVFMTFIFMIILSLILAIFENKGHKNGYASLCC